MTLTRLSLSLAAGCALGASALMPAQAAARTNFDGNWSVLIVTRRFSGAIGFDVFISSDCPLPMGFRRARSIFWVSAR